MSTNSLPCKIYAFIISYSKYFSRVAMPTERQLRNFIQGRTLSEQGPVDSHLITKTFDTLKGSTFLTLTRKGEYTIYKNKKLSYAI